MSTSESESMIKHMKVGNAILEAERDAIRRKGSTIRDRKGASEKHDQKEMVRGHGVR